MARNDATDTFRASVMAKIAAWKAVLDSYDAAVSLDGGLNEAAVNSHHGRQMASDGGKAMDLPVGVFRDKSLREAVEIYLGAGRRKQTNKEIALGLQKGGIPTTSKFFEATVATALGRMKDDGLVLRFPDGWDLAASYPDSLRNRLDKDSPKATRAKRKEKKVRGRSATKAAPKEPKQDKTAIIFKLVVDGTNGLKVRDLVAGLSLLGIDASKDYIRVVARRLQQRGLIQLRDGKYYPVK
jgi:hypothetical protein